MITVEQLKPRVRESRANGAVIDLMQLANEHNVPVRVMFDVYSQSTAEVDAEPESSQPVASETEPDAAQPSPSETQTASDLAKPEDASEELPQPTTETPADIEPLTQPEKESEEFRQYEIARTAYWQDFYDKNEKTLPVPITAQQKQQLVFNAIEADLQAFKASVHQIIGADRKPNKDTVLVFRQELDADEIRELGFDTVAAVKGSGSVPFKTAITMLKMKYKRVVLFGESAANRMIQEQITPGAVYVDEYDLAQINRKFNNPQGYKETDLKKLIQDVLDSDAVKSCSVLRSADAIRENVFNTLSWGIDHIDTVDPRAVIQCTMDSLRRMQFLDGRFPAPLTEKSLTGIIGDFVDLAYPTTVACREMLLYQMLPVIGALLGATYYLPYGSDKHFPSLFSLAIGRTSDGKGQAKHHIEDAIRLVEPAWFSQNVFANPASGEGLVRMLAGKGLVLGGKKNRVVVYNSEMVTTFNASARKDSTLSGNLRTAYDGDRIENFRSDTKKSYTADNYILGFCGMITPQELKDVMPAMDWKNGAANRFLWSIGFKDKTLGRSAKQPDFTKWADRVRKLVELNKGADLTAIDYSDSGKRAWDEWFYSLPEHNDDTLSESQARAAANCVRVANLYAQLDERRLDGWLVQLDREHVEAAIEIVNRSRQSVEWYLTQAHQVSPTESGATQEELMKLKSAVAAAGRETGVPELTQGDIAKLFSHKTTEERDELCILAGLKPYSRANGREDGRGRPVTVWTWNDK